MTAPGSSPGVSAQPRTPPPAPENADDAEAGRSGELRAVPDGDRLAQIEDLARVLDPRAWLPADDNESLRLDRELRQTKARLQADRALVAGFRRVAEDPETVERVAHALAKADDWWPWDQPNGVVQDVAVNEEIKTGFRDMARAALAALRGGEQQ